MKSSLSIGALAQRAGLRTSAIRYYESIGLIPPAERISGRRVYAPSALERLKRIAFGQAAGFSLEEVKRLERGYADPDTAPARWRELAQRKLLDVERQLTALREVRELLHQALRCECRSLRTCPLLTGPIRRRGRAEPGRRPPKSR